MKRNHSDFKNFDFGDFFTALWLELGLGPGLGLGHWGFGLGARGLGLGALVNLVKVSGVYVYTFIKRIGIVYIDRYMYVYL